MANNYYATVQATASPTGLGLVYVSETETATPNYQETPSSVKQSKSNQTSAPSFTFHLYAQPAELYSFHGWVLNGTTVSTEPHYSVTVTGSTTESFITNYTAEFGAKRFLTVVPNQYGTATIDNPDNVPGDVVTVSTRAVYNTPELSSIGAINIPNRNFIFQHWEDSDGNIVSYEKTFSLTVEKEMSLTPVYDNPSTIKKATGYYRIMSCFNAPLSLVGQFPLNFSNNQVLWGDINFVRNPEGLGGTSTKGYGYGTNNIYNDPSQIIYVSGTLNSSNAQQYNSGKDVLTKAVLSAQGKSTSDYFSNELKIKWSVNPGYHNVYSSIVGLKFSESAQYHSGGDVVYVGRDDNSVQSLFHFEPITEEFADIWWFGAFPSEQMYYDGGYWTSMYTAFPYRCYEPDGVEAYIISDYTFDGQSNTAVLKRIENGIVPAYTAVLLKCPKVIDTDSYITNRVMPEPANRLIPLEPNDASIDNTVAEGNLLKGEFQLNTQRPVSGLTSEDIGHVRFNAETMRIFSANANNEVGFYVLPANADGTAQELAANKAYLDLTAIPAEARTSSFRIVSEDEAAGIDNIIVKPEPTVREGIYDLYGHRVEHMIPGNIYIVNGVKTLAR